MKCVLISVFSDAYGSDGWYCNDKRWKCNSERGEIVYTSSYSPAKWQTMMLCNDIQIIVEYCFLCSQLVLETTIRQLNSCLKLVI